ncbi:MAG: creatininase family protein [Bacteroidales bacterium]
MIENDLIHACYHGLKHDKYDLAVLPWGATEPHNYHLPYGTDFLLARSVALESARVCAKKDIRVMVLPSVPFGSQNPGQREEPFCIHINTETQKLLLRDIVKSLHYQGLRKLVIMNGHGGNSFQSIVRDLSFEFPDFFIAIINWYAVVPAGNYFQNPDDHAGELETSVMMYYFPGKVDLSKAGNGKGRPFAIDGLNEGVAWTPRIWNKASRDTGIGDPSLSTAEKGKAYATEVVKKISDFFTDLATKELY